MRTQQNHNTVLFLRPCTWVWLGLILLTFSALFIGQAGLGGTGIVGFLLLSTLIKTQMVADYFMGLKRSRRIWRAIVTLYLFIVMSLLGLAYWLSLT